MKNEKVLKKLKDWVVNPDERYFLFTDASLRKVSNNKGANCVIGLGAELRNSLAKKVLFYSENIFVKREVASEKNPEFIALENALELILNQGVRKVTVQTDLNSLAPRLNSYFEAHLFGNEDKKIEIISQSRMFWIELFQLIEKFEDFFIEYIPRELNKNADMLSRSAGILKEQDENIRNSKINERKDFQKLKFLDLTKPRTIQAQNETSIVLTNLHKHYEDFKYVYDENSLFFKIKDVKEKKSFVFEVHEHSLKKTIDKPIYHKKYVLKYGQDKGLAFLFLLTALATDKNKNKLFNEVTLFSVNQEVVYSHDFWADFTELNDCFSYVGSKKKYFYFHFNLRLLLRNARKKMVVESMTKEQSVNLMRVLKKYHKAIKINFVKNLNLFERLKNTPDGEKINLPENVIKKKVMQKENKVNIKDKNPYYLYPLDNPSKVENKGFSFLEYGLKMKVNTPVVA